MIIKKLLNCTLTGKCSIQIYSSLHNQPLVPSHSKLKVGKVLTKYSSMKYSNKLFPYLRKLKESKTSFGKYLKNHSEKYQYLQEKSFQMIRSKLSKYKIINKF